MIAFEARNKIAQAIRDVHTSEPAAMQAAVTAEVTRLRADKPAKWGHWILLIAGVGIFCGCVGKSAQFPLHVWLPDAMEGPTPVSALVHSATMVAAGVFLVGRVYPLFSAEALLVIAVIGCITLFIAATIAVTQVDIKRVLAYSTISQLGFMMLALGLGGWLAGLFHLITHAFFKSLLFLCSRLGDSRRPHQRHAATWAASARRCRSRLTRCSSVASRSPASACRSSPVSAVSIRKT